MAKVCIICEKETDGSAVADDFVIRTIRAVKQRFGIAKNNILVVCSSCMEEHRKRRERYERNLVMHVLVAAIILFAFVLLPVFTTGFSVSALVLGILLAAIIIGLSIFSHHPKLAPETQKPKPEEKKGQRGRKRK
ncbi:MAG: hypothetical protein N3E51_02325 [Candidatus Micrarchaeota archaeon]|nr:hypothetical protein [Candidatus Micrarchaeota archaeon]